MVHEGTTQRQHSVSPRAARREIRRRVGRHDASWDRLKVPRERLAPARECGFAGASGRGPLDGQVLVCAVPAGWRGIEFTPRVSHTTPVWYPPTRVAPGA